MTSGIAKAFYRQCGLILVQPLGKTIRLGAIGYFDKGQWIPVGTTKKMFGVDLSLAPTPPRSNSFDAKYGKRIKFEVKGKGEMSKLVTTVAQAKARAEISFGSEGAFVLNVKNQGVASIEDLADLMAAIRFAYRFRNLLPEGRRWEKKYAVVVGLANADSVTALSATDKNAFAIVTGGAKLAAPVAPADLDARMTVSVAVGSVQKIWQVPAEGYAFQALRISPSVFKSWHRQDLVFVAQTGPLARPGRPPSFVHWAEVAKLEPTRFRVQVLGPTGRAVGETTVSRLSQRRIAYVRSKRRTKRH